VTAFDDKDNLNTTEYEETISHKINPYQERLRLYSLL